MRAKLDQNYNYEARRELYKENFSKAQQHAQESLVDLHDRVSGLYKKANPNAAPGDEERDKIKQFCRGMANRKLGLTIAKRNVKTYVEAINEANGTAWVYDEYPEEKLTGNATTTEQTISTT